MPTGTISGNSSSVYCAIRHPDHRFTIWIDESEARFPQVCSCCLSSQSLVEPGQPLSEQGRQKFHYPICDLCQKHATLEGFFMMLGVFVGVVGTPIIYYLLLGFRIPGFFWVIILIYLVGVVVIAYLIYLPGYFLIRHYKTERCSSSGWPIQLSRIPISDSRQNFVDGMLESKTEHDVRKIKEAIIGQAGIDSICLEFRNPEYAESFLESNGFPFDEVLILRETEDEADA